MKERPIIFSGPSVKAILEGRKTMTRRVVKPQLEPVLNGWKVWDKMGGYFGFYDNRKDVEALLLSTCPCGQPGDGLWVRETWSTILQDSRSDTEGLVYRADGERDGQVWRPSMFMPRWASRLTLEVTGVRVERLQEIGEEDALAEGVCDIPGGCHYSAVHVQMFQQRWDAINGKKYPWARNVWVWVIEFRRCEPEVAA